MSPAEGDNLRVPRNGRCDCRSPQRPRALVDLLDDSACLLVLGSSLTVMSSVRCVLGRAAVAFVVALAAACGYVPAARAFSTNTEIAFQANTGDLWTWAIDNPGSSTGMGMMAGSGPSVAPLPGFGSNHEIAFQAKTGYLWTTGAFGQGATPYGMMAATSPSINKFGEIAFQGNTGHLRTTGLFGGDSALAMMAGTSPSMNLNKTVAFQDSQGR